MAKEAYVVAFSVQNLGPGWDAVSEAKKSTTARTAGQPYQLKANGKSPWGQVFESNVCEVEAESTTEACEIAKTAYGPQFTGFALVAKASNVEAKEF